MRIPYKSEPFGAGHISNMHLAIDRLGGTGSPIDVGSCIGGVVQHPQHIMVLDLSPHNLSVMWTAPDPPRKEEVFPAKVAHRRTGRAGLLKAVKDLPNGGLDLHIGVKHNRVADRV